MKYDNLIQHIKDNDYLFAGYSFISDGKDFEKDIDGIIISTQYYNYFSQLLLGKLIGGKVVIYNSNEELEKSTSDAIALKTITEINAIKDDNKTVAIFDDKLISKNDIAIDIVEKIGYEVIPIHKNVYTLPCGKILAEVA